MSKGRAVAKYGTAGVFTALLGAAVMRVKLHPEADRPPFRDTAIAAGIMAGAIWLIASL